MHEVALVDLADADPAGDRRADGAVLQLRGGVVDLRLVVEDLRLRRVHRGALLVELLAAGEVLEHEVGVAVQVEDGTLQRRLVLGAVGDLLGQHRLQRAWVDDRQRVAGLHVLALGEQDLRYLAVDAALHADRVVGLHRADARQQDGHVLHPHRGHAHLHRRGCRARRRRRRCDGRRDVGPHRADLIDHLIDADAPIGRGAQGERHKHRERERDPHAARIWKSGRCGNDGGVTARDCAIDRFLPPPHCRRPYRMPNTRLNIWGTEE